MKTGFFDYKNWVVWKLNYFHISKHLAILADLIFLFMLILNYFNTLPEFWNIKYLFLVVVILNVLFFTLKIKKIPEEKRSNSLIVYYSGHFFLLSLIVIAINQFLKRDIVTNNLFYISVVSIAFGFLTFYASRDRVEKEIEEEKEKEEKAEKKRYAEFGEKFPKLNKIWGIRSIVRWMYGEGRGFSVPLVLIAVVFIVIKIGIPLIYTGSFIDEYNHIFSGIEFFKTGHFAEIFQNGIYMRWGYVSLFAGLFNQIFGKTIFVAKMVPATIGMIDFFLLYLISKTIIKRKRYVLILMLIYTISPWVIFNHFYIRGYVFYELFFLTLTYCFFKLVENLKKRDMKRVKIYSALFFLTNLGNYFLSYDSSKNLIIFISILYLLYLFFFEMRIKNKIFIFILAGLVFIPLLNPLDKISILFHPNLISTSSLNLKYDYYFFSLNLLFTTFFFLSLITLKKIKTKKTAFIFVGTSIFLIHLISSPSLQIFRGVLYFLPVYYLISIYSLSRLGLKKQLIILICFLFLLIIVNNFPKDYSNGPYIPGEVIYRDYQSAYSQMQIDCINSTIYSSLDRPYISEFYNVHTEYSTFTDINNIREDIRYHNYNGSYSTILGDVPVKTDDWLKEIIEKNEKTCLIVYSKQGYSGNFITTQEFEKLPKYFNETKFRGVNVYVR